MIGDNVARITAQIANKGCSNIIVGLNPTDYLTMQLAKASTAGRYVGVPPNRIANLLRWRRDWPSARYLGKLRIRSEQRVSRAFHTQTQQW